MTLDYEYIVCGLGGFGSAAAYWLARRAGTEVLGLEQFELGHVRGESQDHSRIIRLSYHAPHYVELAKHAFAAWAEVERDSGEQLVLRTGGLDLGPRVSAIPLSTYADSMDAAGVSYERLDAGEIMRRWPPWRLGDDIHGLFQEQAGIAMAARGNATHVRMAREHGATLLDRTPVESIRHLDGEVEVVAGGKAYRARRLVVAAGAWSLPDLDLDGRPLLLRLPRLRRAGTQGRPGRRRAGSDGRYQDLRRGRARARSRDPLSPTVPPVRAGAGDLHQDLPLHADAGP
jgi:sarcosine oxidase